MKMMHAILAAFFFIAESGLAPASPPGVPRPGRPDFGRPRFDHPGRRPLPVGRRIFIRQATSGHADELRAMRILQGVFNDARCERIGDSLRRLSNAILSSASEANSRDQDLIPGDQRSELRRRARTGWRQTFRSRIFWETVFSRLSEAYRSCDATCMDDGDAIGAISGTMYCAANAGVGGLDAPGFLAQNLVPMCETSIFVGCQQSFRQAAQAYDGCSAYLSGSFEQTFLESISQDCHVELP